MKSLKDYLFEGIFDTDTDAMPYLYHPKNKNELIKCIEKIIKDHKNDKIIDLNCRGGVIRDCRVAREYGLPVMPPDAEVEAVRRDIELCRETGCALHIQHISCSGTVDLIRAAQKENLPVTGEATPHHLLFSCEDIPENDANWKMAPPLGNHDDRAAIRAAVKDGTLGIFATDHAPHPSEMKRGGFVGSANGIIGLETAVAITYKVMVEDEGMDVNEWAKRWTEGPAHLIGEEPDGETVIDLEANRTVDPQSFKSLSRNMPYGGLCFSAWPLPTVPRK